METYKVILILSAYWIIFFWKFLRNPNLLSTSEVASTFYPQWVWQGREWRRGRVPLKDNIFYKYPACVPFLSTFYPWQILSSLTGSFSVYVYGILGHYLLCSVLSFLMFSQWMGLWTSLFGALTLTYSGYFIKPQTPCFAYSHAWLPGWFLPWPMNFISVGMSLLGGYFPVVFYMLPFTFLVDPMAVILGCVVALPQLVAFAWYLPKSVRWGRKEDGKLGRVPWWKLKDLFLKTTNLGPTNGVHYPEMEMYMGVAPLLLVLGSTSRFWFVLALGILIAVGLIPPLARIPARALYLVSISIVILSTDGLGKLPELTCLAITVLQGFLLLKNRDIYPSFPFSQWWDGRKELDRKYTDETRWPHFSGYLQGRRVSQYQGDFRMK